MKFVLASLVALTAASSSTYYSSSSTGCHVGKNGIQAAWMGDDIGCLCPAEFRYEQDQGCERICTLGENGVQASFKGKDHDGEDICQCPKHFAYDEDQGCVRTSSSTVYYQSTATYVPPSTSTVYQPSTTVVPPSSSTKYITSENTYQSTPSNPCNQDGQAHADFVWGECQCPAEFQYDEDQGCERICTLGDNGVQASFRLAYEDGQPVCLCPPPFEYVHEVGCQLPKSTSTYYSSSSTY